MNDVDAAKAAQAERARQQVGNADDQLVALFLANVRGDGTDGDRVARAARERQAKAMERIQGRLRREAGGITFTGLLVLLLNDAATAQGWR
ncbi:MAG TPA: hypothetical protein VEA38_00805 [Terriglobales bacterium]|nr:hypothetical protein [Terriglobales bacterium]